MKTRIYGSHKTETKEETRSALKWATSFLLPEEYDKLDVRVCFRNDEEDVATCIKIDRYTYRILISDKLNVSDFYIALFHEVVHIKQFCTGDLKIYNAHVIFMNERHDKDDYWFSPWEIEAYGMAPGLCAKYFLTL